MCKNSGFITIRNVSVAYANWMHLQQIEDAHKAGIARIPESGGIQTEGEACLVQSSTCLL